MDKETVKEVVKYYISEYSKVSEETISDAYILKKQPLRLTNLQLGFMALDLRAYIQEINPKEKLWMKDTRKKDLTVAGLCTLIYKKVMVKKKSAE